MMWGYGPWMGGGMGWSMLMGGGFWILVVIGVFLIVWLARGRDGYATLHHRRSAGLEALDERYAKGEVNRDEYLQKKKDITG